MGFLRQLFGPSQAEVWRRLAEETGSNFVDSAYENDPEINLTSQPT